MGRQRKRAVKKGGARAGGGTQTRFAVLHTELLKKVPAWPSSLCRMRVNACQNGTAMGLVNLLRDEQVRGVWQAVVCDDKAQDAASVIVRIVEVGQRDFAVRVAR
jgi:hypothetical protein